MVKIMGIGVAGFLNNVVGKEDIVWFFHMSFP